MDRPLRVVQWGTGNTGSVALPAIAATQGLDLIGVCVTTKTSRAEKPVSS
jgi:hypothetical protein